MARFAIIDAGRVINIVESDSGFAAMQGWVPADDCRIGDLWDGQVFSAAPADPAYLLAAAKAQRQTLVDAITVTTASGKVFDGNEEAQRRMTSAITAMDDGDELPWVLHDNTVAVVTRAELREALRLAGSEMAAIWIAPYQQG